MAGAATAAAIASAGVGVYQAAKGAPKAPSFESTTPQLQSTKQADTELANAIKSKKSKAGFINQSPTLLTGSLGVPDDQLNLGKKTILGG